MENQPSRFQQVSPLHRYGSFDLVTADSLRCCVFTPFAAATSRVRDEELRSVTAELIPFDFPKDMRRVANLAVVDPTNEGIPLVSDDDPDYIRSILLLDRLQPEKDRKATDHNRATYGTTFPVKRRRRVLNPLNAPWGISSVCYPLIVGTSEEKYICVRWNWGGYRPEYDWEDRHPLAKWLIPTEIELLMRYARQKVIHLVPMINADKTVVWHLQPEDAQQLAHNHRLLSATTSDTYYQLNNIVYLDDLKIWMAFDTRLLKMK